MFDDICKTGQALAALFLTALFLATPAQAAEFKTVERIKHYSVSGKTGPQLYESIGKNGPRIRGGRPTIALTSWDLKWRRNYQPRGSACTLVSAKPFFTITYTLPKPAAKLRGATARHWKVFAAGIAAHEKVHGKYARAMVDTIIRTTVSLTVEGDPKCRKIRAEVLKRVKAALATYNVRSRAFDREEMAAGGNVHALILRLLEGG